LDDVLREEADLVGVVDEDAVGSVFLLDKGVQRA
jgi:hypothetical protein